MKKILLRSLLLPGLSLMAVGCDSSSQSHDKDDHSAVTVKRVEVKNPTPEIALTTVMLSEDAQRHLDIKTCEVKRESVPQFRTYGGYAVVPEGRSITISAPLTGTIAQHSGASWPQPGSQVAIGAILFELNPSLRGDREVLSPADRISLARTMSDLEAACAQALGDVDATSVKLESAAIAMRRAERLVKENAGSVRALDEATANHRLAQTELDAAQSRAEVLRKTLSDIEGSAEDSSLFVTSPFEGILQKLLVANREFVGSGAPLCEIIAIHPIWIKVPVYVGDMALLARGKPARVFGLGDSEDRFRMARPVSAPPTANSKTFTVDWYYEIENPELTIVPEQRFMVDIPVHGAEEALVIPWASVVHDIHGDQWAYRESTPGVYVRQRVAVLRVVEDRASIVRGLSQGDQVVYEGVAELFGIEFGSAGH